MNRFFELLFERFWGAVAFVFLSLLVYVAVGIGPTIGVWLFFSVPILLAYIMHSDNN